jgi:hypothetical protein
MANATAIESSKRAGKGGNKKASKPSDVCVYVWDKTDSGWGWSKVDLADGETVKQVTDKLAQAGKHAVPGKLSIGAPEGAPTGWTDPDAHGNVNGTNANEDETKVMAAVKAMKRKLADIVAATGLDDRRVDKILQKHRKAGTLSFLKGVGWCLTAALQNDEEQEQEEPTVAKVVADQIAQGAAPALATNQTVRELIAAEVEEPKPKKARKAKQEPIDQAPIDVQAVEVPAEQPEPVEAAAPIVPADFLLFIGGNFYTKDSFIAEAAAMGISRRMPSHRIPRDLVSGTSRVFVAAEGKRKADDGANTSEVFGYFVPGRVEFISLGHNKKYADIIASLQMRPDSRIVDSIKEEQERGCGTRKEGGAYLVVDKADSPLHLLPKPATYVGNHFRGLMRLHPAQAAQFEVGGEVVTLVEEVCMIEGCGKPFKCAPDGHIRATRERKRMEKGEEPKWLLACGECRRKAMAEKAQARKAVEGSVEVDETDEEGNDALLGTD